MSDTYGESVRQLKQKIIFLIKNNILKRLFVRQLKSGYLIFVFNDQGDERMRRAAGESERITLRLDPAVVTYYKKEAQCRGKSLSIYLRELLEAGHMVDQVEQTKLDMEEMLAQFKADMIKINSEKQVNLPDRVLKSIARAEVMLSEIVESNGDKQLLHRLYAKAVDLVKKFGQPDEE